jgi:uncharacterized protein YpuA (DUF1002 family)
MIKMRNTLIRAENSTGQLLPEKARVTPLVTGKSGGHAKTGTSNGTMCQPSTFAEALQTNGISQQTVQLDL